jgi:HAD superfamily hydrolase (TIGR01458 family)
VTLSVLANGPRRVRPRVREHAPMSPEAIRASAVLIDLDGVLYVGEEPIAGAQAAVATLRERGLGLRFVTNTTARSRAQTTGKLRRLGFAVSDDEVVTPAALAVDHCIARGHQRVTLVMADAVKEDFAVLDEVDTAADAVIVGDLGESFGYEPLNRAFRLVMDGAELVALQKNRFWMTADGLSLDAGPFVAALEYATGHEAHVVGKPAPAFFASVLEGVGVRASDAVMVGDDIEFDIGGALAAGLAGILVQTGKYREDRLRASGIVPTAVVATVADVPALLT